MADGDCGARARREALVDGLDWCDAHRSVDVPA